VASGEMITLDEDNEAILHYNNCGGSPVFGRLKSNVRHVKLCNESAFRVLQGLCLALINGMVKAGIKSR